MVTELMEAVLPFLNAAQEALSEVTHNLPREVEGTSTFNHLPVLEVNSQMLVPAKTHLRDIVTSAAISHSVAPSEEGVQAVTVLPQTMPLGGQSEAAGPPFTCMLGQGGADEAGPSQQRAFFHNSSLESSIRNRILRLESGKSFFLLDKEKGEYWAEIKKALDQASSQGEYHRLLEFENRDLQIRELKHSCFSLFQQVLSQHPDLAENAAYNPQEAFIDFFDEKRDELDTQHEWSPAERDRRELQFLNKVGQDIRERGRASIYIKKILGYADNE